MFTKDEKKELCFFAQKVADVHGGEHVEYIRVNEIVRNIEKEDLLEESFIELKKLTNNYAIPDDACRAMTSLLNLIKKLDIY